MSTSDKLRLVDLGRRARQGKSETFNVYHSYGYCEEVGCDQCRVLSKLGKDKWD